MKVALASIGLIGAGGVAHAQSSVTLAGILDAGFEMSKVGALKSDPSNHPVLYRFQNGNLQASRLIFRGTEDMGGGMKTLFFLESQFNLGDGTLAGSGLFTREAWVALATNQGTLVMGRYRAPTFWVYLFEDANTYKLDSFTAPNIHHQAVLSQIFGAQRTSSTLGGAFTGLGGFSNNTISYKTPVLFGGLTSEVTYSNGANGVQDNSQDGKNLGANLIYSNGIFQIGYGFNNSHYYLDGEMASLKTHIVGALYKFSWTTVGADYIYASDSVGRFASSWSVTDVTPVGPSGQLNLGVGHILSSQVGGVGHATSFDAGYVYFLSKRTQLYTIYTKLFNGANSTIGLGTLNGPPSNESSFAKVTPGFNPWAMTVGLRHSF
ncbi:porin [Burkholderia sp. BCC0405]|uniref:porin n=1 Tax=Burkholderia sp. BCC0405 TaxID=2676298 RepID=UPI00158F2DC7|nr:porin [Burkholderia sp. BCC0405]